ncbi:M14-type cytosolic carboxypeptidase, partial [Vibrio splendidus]
MKIFSNFESGNIHVVSADSPQNIQLTIPADNQTEI